MAIYFLFAGHTLEFQQTASQNYKVGSAANTLILNQNTNTNIKPLFVSQSIKFSSQGNNSRIINVAAHNMLGLSQLSFLPINVSAFNNLILFHKALRVFGGDPSQHLYLVQSASADRYRGASNTLIFVQTASARMIRSVSASQNLIFVSTSGVFQNDPCFVVPGDVLPGPIGGNDGRRSGTC